MATKLSDIAKVVERALKGKDVLEVAGEVAVESIKKRTRLGKGVPDNLGGAQALPKLKTNTVRNRKLLKSKGELSGPGATPAKSGLNKSGELLNSVDYEIKGDQLVIELDSRKQQEKALNLIKIDKGFTFMNLSKAEFNRMVKAMSKALDKVVKNIKFDKL